MAQLAKAHVVAILTPHTTACAVCFLDLWAHTGETVYRHPTRTQPPDSREPGNENRERDHRQLRCC